MILHNLRIYDSHLIMQGVEEHKEKTINSIANNSEKYISFSIDNLEFKDSLQFLNSSLEKLVKTLRKYIDNDKVDFY